MFSADTYTERRKKLSNNVSDGIILLLGNDESPMNYFDNTFHFRQDSSFLYFFGLNFPQLAAIIDLDEGKEIVFGNDLTVEDIVWMGTQPTLLERGQAYGLSEVRPLSALEDYLKKTVSQGRKIHYLPPYRHENKIKLLNLLGIHPNVAASKSSQRVCKAGLPQ